MATAEALITENIDLWTGAIKRKSGVGRGKGSSKKIELYGVKKLRELILEMAVRGLLVPQDASDEPASVLLERIAAEKAELVKEGKVKKQKALAAIRDNEKPFELPGTWKWARLEYLIFLVSGQHLSTNQYTDKEELGCIPYISGPADFGLISPSPMRFTQVRRSVAIVDDILLTVKGSGVGKLNVVTQDELAIGRQIMAVRSVGVESKFIHMYLLNHAKHFQLQKTGIAIPGISRDDVLNVVLGLPPLTEQHRIVAKVDELMALCDQLEQQTEANISAHQTLVETLLQAITRSDSSANSAESIELFFANFDSLFTTEESVDQLKQTILQLAVMGKLVPQDPSDEPASVLLEKIATEKEKLVKEKKIKKQKALPPIGDEEKPFELPVGWELCYLDDLALSSEAGWSPKCEGIPRESNNWGVLKVSAVTWGRFNADENKQLPSHLEARPELEVKENDFLISRANTAELVARSVVVPDNSQKCLMMSDKIIRFTLSDYVFPEYINLVNNSQGSREYYARVAGGTSSSMKNVSRKQIQMLQVMVPPFEEQHRIVVKASKLMILCDQLKAQLNTVQTTQLYLADAVTEQAIA